MSVISVHVGGCGLRTGASFWQALGHEHGIDAGGSAASDKGGRRPVYFDECKDGGWRPRAVLVDTVPDDLAAVGASKWKAWFPATSMVTGDDTGAGGAADDAGTSASTFATAFAGEGGAAGRRAMEALRRAAEAADSVQGFQITHSVSGGTGAGLGSAMVYCIKQEFPHKMTAAFPVFPDWRTDDGTDAGGDHVYNAGFAMQHLVEDVDWAVVLDNAALARVCRGRYGCAKPTVADLNRVAARVMSDATFTMRFQCGRSKDLRQVGVNLVPFPRGHFLVASCSDAPTSGDGRDVDRATGALSSDTADERKVPDAGGSGAGAGAGAGTSTADAKARVTTMVRDLFLPASVLCRPEPRTEGCLQMLTGQVLLRGSCAARHIGAAEGVLRAAEKLGAAAHGQGGGTPPLQELDGSMIAAPVFVAGGEFQPDGIPCVASGVAPEGVSLSASMLCNSLIMAEVFEDVGRRFSDRLQRREGMQRFIGHGDVDEMSFTEAESALGDIEGEYTPATGADVTDSDDDPAAQ